MSGFLLYTSPEEYISVNISLSIDSGAAHPIFIKLCFLKYFLIWFIDFFLKVSISFLIFLNNCSFDRKTGIWKEHNKKIIEEAKSEKKLEKIFKQNKIFDQEIESKDIIVVSEKKENARTKVLTDEIVSITEKLIEKHKTTKA